MPDVKHLKGGVFFDPPYCILSLRKNGEIQMDPQNEVLLSLTVLLTGLVVVFAMLIFLTIVIKIYGSDVYKRQGLFLVRAVAVVPADADDAVCFLHTGDHLAERCVLPVQMRSILHHNEKLRAGRIGIHGPRHREDSTCMLQRIRESISREFAFAAISRTCLLYTSRCV